MKEFLVIFAVAGALVACNNDTTENRYNDNKINTDTTIQPI
jgi:hypothetical protein